MSPPVFHSAVLLCLPLLIAISCSSAFAGDKMYVITEPDGTKLFSNKPPKGSQNAQVFTSKKSGFSWYRMTTRGRRSSKLFRTKFDSVISSACKKYKLDEALVRAVIHVESAFNPRAVSPKGAVGLMQIMPFNFRRLGVKDGFEPIQNVNGGARLLSQLKSRYKGDMRLALAAYNAGEQAVARYKGVPPYRETQLYVRKVMEFRKKYQQKSS